MEQYANNAMVGISQLQGSQDASLAHPVVSAESARAIAVSARQELGAQFGPLSFQIPTVHLVSQADTLYLDQPLAQSVPQGAIVPSCQGRVEFVSLESTALLIHSFVSFVKLEGRQTTNQAAVTTARLDA